MKPIKTRQYLSPKRDFDVVIQKNLFVIFQDLEPIQESESFALLSPAQGDPFFLDKKGRKNQGLDNTS